MRRPRPKRRGSQGRRGFAPPSTAWSGGSPNWTCWSSSSTRCSMARAAPWTTPRLGRRCRAVPNSAASPFASAWRGRGVLGAASRTAPVRAWSSALAWTPWAPRIAASARISRPRWAKRPRPNATGASWRTCLRSAPPVCNMSTSSGTPRAASSSCGSLWRTKTQASSRGPMRARCPHSSWFLCVRACCRYWRSRPSSTRSHYTSPRQPLKVSFCWKSSGGSWSCTRCDSSCSTPTT
mmetsp:Transcript_16431/g.47082  ORF Transcript_16431/g.47082 Transcript_16431/m.47082 type:complete len:237 (-) Transcript_16431:1279-1989(-)